MCRRGEGEGKVLAEYLASVANNVYYRTPVSGTVVVDS